MTQPIQEPTTGREMSQQQYGQRQLYRRPAPPSIRTLLFIMEGGGNVLDTGIRGDVQLHDEFLILSWSLLADTDGDIVVDVWKDVYANYPPTDADSITGGNEPFISGDDHNTDSTLSGWTTTIQPGDTLRFNIDSVATITRCTIAIELLG